MVLIQRGEFYLESLWPWKPNSFDAEASMEAEEMELDTGDAREDCHALAVVLPKSVGIEDVELALSKVDQWPTTGGSVPWKLWVQPATCQFGSHEATALRYKELFRPISNRSLRPARATLIQFADGYKELVVVARKSAISRTVLQKMIALVCYNGELDISGSPPTASSVIPSSGRARAFPPNWAINRTGSPTGIMSDAETWFSREVVDGAVDCETWALALSATMRMYDVREGQLIGVLCADYSEVLNSITEFTVNIDQIGTARIEDDLVAIREHKALPFRDDGNPPVGLMWSNLPADGRVELHSQEYIASLANPYALTVRVSKVARYRTNVSIHVCDRRLNLPIIEQFMEHLLRVYVWCSSNPGAQLNELCMDEESHTEVDDGALLPLLPKMRGTVELLRELSLLVPEQVAISEGASISMTWKELVESATRVASGLRRRGVGARQIVGVYMDRTALQVIAQLAVWMTGSAYLPMDPASPEARNAYICQDSDLSYVITAPDTCLNMDGIQQVPISELLAEEIVDGTYDLHDPDLFDPAYIIYTSGSTGHPKGVVVSHANLAALVSSTRHAYGIGEHDVWSAFHSSAFDFSVWEVWCCLATGGHLVMVPYWTSRDPAAFWELLETYAVTILSQTPSAFRHLIEHDRSQVTLLAIRLVVLGGEALEAAMVLPWLDRYGTKSCCVVNMYGITETTVHVTMQVVGRHEALVRSSSIGIPLRGWQVSVLDRNGNPAVDGAVGELYVSGAGVAIGYLNQQTLTEQRFPTRAGGLCRMYKTGDIGIQTSDGSLHYLGRLDDQVKIRGFRIELGEIRSALMECPSVIDAAVLVKKLSDVQGSDELRAYVVITHGSVNEVGEFLRSHLPSYMWPSALLVVPSIPMTVNGKVDGQRLSQLEVPTSLHPYCLGQADDSKSPGPGDAVATEWQKAFGRKLTKDDDFFESGGHSLLAIQIVAGLREIGWQNVAVRDIFMHPSIRSLTDFLMTTRAS